MEVSGAGCVQLTMLRTFTRMEVEWAEGWSLPAVGNYASPEASSEAETDTPAYGRLGLSGGIVCDIPEPRPGIPALIAVTGNNGHAWLTSPSPVLIQGVGAEAMPVSPEFLTKEDTKDFFTRVIERLMQAFDTGDIICSGHDYRQSLEIAIALKQSAARSHERISLPLQNRSLKIYPHPYRHTGGDVAGWESIGYSGPPEPLE